MARGWEERPSQLATRRWNVPALTSEDSPRPEPEYGGLLTGISELLDQARRMSARTVNNILTATYWEIGRRIVELNRREGPTGYGEEVLARLANDLTAKHGRGF